MKGLISLVYSKDSFYFCIYLNKEKVFPKLSIFTAILINNRFLILNSYYYDHRRSERN
jgi:hypothetical protein